MVGTVLHGLLLKRPINSERMQNQMKRPTLPSLGTYVFTVAYITICIFAGLPLLRLMNYLSSLGPFWAEFLSNGVIGGMFFMGGACVTVLVVVLSIRWGVYWGIYVGIYVSIYKGIYRNGIYNWTTYKWEVYKGQR
jgi:hypothetical protein